jgi:predicted TIM-barrel fold metal-dependent hydrolase
MTTVEITENVDDADLDTPLILVSSDTHIGPRMSDMRPYCEEKYITQFDELADTLEAQRKQAVDTMLNRLLQFPEFEEAEDSWESNIRWNCRSAGHYDMHARLRDLDHDGVAADLILHGSQNGEPVPWNELGTPVPSSPEHAVLRAAGQRIYNRWLADACTIEPDRHIGIAQIPIWDLEASVKEIQWAREAGLRGVNFNRMVPDLPAYNEAHWEPLWEVCEALEMPLTNHGSGGPFYSGPEGLAMSMVETSIWAQRLVFALVFSRAFERHPGLKLVIAEQLGVPPSIVARNMDSVWHSPVQKSQLRRILTKAPSEYMRSNVFFGLSFQSHGETEEAVNDGYVANAMWGSDYPHAEGTWRYSEDESETPLNHLALRKTFAGAPIDAVRLMAGENAARVYGLDLEKLQEVANNINAPTFREVSVPLDSDPRIWGSCGFREFGGWA